MLEQRWTVSCRPAGNPGGLEDPKTWLHVPEDLHDLRNGKRLTPWILDVEMMTPVLPRHREWFVIPLSQRARWMLELFAVRREDIASSCRNPDQGRYALELADRLAAGYPSAVLSHQRLVAAEVQRLHDQGLLPS